MDEFDWGWFRTTMDHSRDYNQDLCGDYLSFIPRLDALASKVVQRPSSPLSSRPQDFVASLAVTRVFRSSLAAVDLLLAGYSESAYGLQRAVWEIGIRCAYIASIDPRGGALALLIDSAKRESSMIEHEFTFRKDSGLETGNLQSTLNDSNARLEELKSHAASFRYDPNKLVRDFADVSIRRICKDLHIENAYEVNFAYLSGFVHSRVDQSPDFVNTTNERRWFNMGPVKLSKNEKQAEFLDIIQQCALSARSVIALIEDPALENEADVMLQQLTEASPHV